MKEGQLVDLANGQQGLVLSRDGATGRYRVQLAAEPWRCVKVNRSDLHPCLPSSTAKNPASNFEEPKAKCDHRLDFCPKPAPPTLAPHLKGVKTMKWPPSPVKRGKMNEVVPKAQIDHGDLYRQLDDICHHRAEDPQEVHRQRKFILPNPKDAEREISRRGYLERRPPVQKGKPHKLLQHADSDGLKALVDADHQTEFDRKLRRHLAFTGKVTIQPPQQGPTVRERLAKESARWKETSDVHCEIRNKEMDDRLERMQQRMEAAKKDRAVVRAEFEDLHAQLGHGTGEMLYESSHHDTIHENAIDEDEEEGDESLEQCISREFKEYEIESMSHGPGSAPSTPSRKDMPESKIASYMDEGFEGFEEDDEVQMEVLDETTDQVAEIDAESDARVQSAEPPLSSASVAEEEPQILNCETEDPE